MKDISGADWSSIEIKVLTDYRDWIMKLIKDYPTTLEDDKKLLSKVKANGS